MWSTFKNIMFPPLFLLIVSLVVRLWSFNQNHLLTFKASKYIFLTLLKVIHHLICCKNVAAVALSENDLE